MDKKEFDNSLKVELRPTVVEAASSGVGDEPMPEMSTAVEIKASEAAAAAEADRVKNGLTTLEIPADFTAPLVPDAKDPKTLTDALNSPVARVVKESDGRLATDLERIFIDSIAA